MLIYNFQKVFIGIDEQDLKILGFKNLAELRAESADFADLFVKIPGYIHNFVHTHWIDFIVYDTKKDFKAVIKAKNIYYKCVLEIKIIYLIDSPLKKAYSINLLNLRALPSDESDKLLKDAQKVPQPEGSSTKATLFEGQDLNKEPLAVDANIVAKEGLLELGEEFTAYAAQKVQETPKPQLRVVTEASKEYKAPTIPKQISEAKIDLMMDYEAAHIPQVAKPITAHKPVQKIEEKKPIEDEIEDLYIYDPKLASNELGLPIDLIEEFLEDFVVQADEFQGSIYKALNEENISDAKSLAHKLKGVAANLRIENAFEVLSIANSSNNLLEIRKNIDKFYKIMTKMAIKKSSHPIIEDFQSTQIKEHAYDENLFINFEDEAPAKTDKNKNSDSAETELIVIDDKDINYDKLSIAKEIGIDDKFFNELFDDYMADSTVLIDSIHEAIQNNNPDLWKNSAHALKGMSNNMRIKQVIEDIDILIGTDNKNTAQDAIEKINTVLKQISKI